MQGRVPRLEPCGYGEGWTREQPGHQAAGRSEAGARLGSAQWRPGRQSVLALPDASLTCVLPLRLNSPEKSRPGSEGHVPSKPMVARRAPEATQLRPTGKGRRPGPRQRRPEGRWHHSRAFCCFLSVRNPMPCDTRLAPGSGSLAVLAGGTVLGTSRRLPVKEARGAECGSGGSGWAQDKPPSHRRAIRRMPRAQTRGEFWEAAVLLGHLSGGAGGKVSKNSSRRVSAC